MADVYFGDCCEELNWKYRRAYKKYKKQAFSKYINVTKRSQEKESYIGEFYPNVFKVSFIIQQN